MCSIYQKIKKKMKKIFLMLGVAAVAALSSCNNGGSSSSESAATVSEDTLEAELPAPAEQKAADVDPYIAKLMENDSTVKVTASGLAYKVIKEGNGSRPTESNTAMVKYTGKHTDGSEFDSSRGEAVEFPLQAVVPGFREGIALMPVGSVYELYIPGKLGYGERGIPGTIAPNELLVFEVELVDFK